MMTLLAAKWFWLSICVLIPVGIALFIHDD
jgi:hypothetical protein